MKQVISFFGSQKDMATALGVTEGAVSQWVSAGGMPAARALQVEMMSKGQIRAVDVTLTKIFKKD